MQHWFRQNNITHYMKIFLKLAAALILTISVLVFFSSELFQDTPASKLTLKPSQLALTIDDCQAIADKSIVKLSAVVEFQRLEIAGRRVRVMQNCMNDRGFVENPAWVKFTEAVVQKSALSSQISLNEAYEQFRRRDMFVSSQASGQALYWMPAIKN